MKRYLCLILLLIASGCETLTGPDTAATLQAESQTYVAEATAIALSAQADQQRVMATADAASTQIADMQSVNRVLLATVRAGDSPTGVVVNPISTPVDLQAGERWFVKTGTSQAVRESDGCVEGAQISFPTDVPRIYATVRAFNVQAGLNMSVNWFYEGNEVWRDSWTLPRDSAEICIWFNIDSSDVEFLPGNWSVSLFADGFQLEDPMNFTMTEAAMMDEN